MRKKTQIKVKLMQTCSSRVQYVRTDANYQEEITFLPVVSACAHTANTSNTPLEVQLAAQLTELTVAIVVNV